MSKQRNQIIPGGADWFTIPFWEGVLCMAAPFLILGAIWLVRAVTR